MPGLYLALLLAVIAINLVAAAAGGLTMTVFFYMAINMLMVMGLAPVVGIPLPFMSYGGSSMLTVMICIGIIMGIDRQTKRSGGRLN